MTYSGFGVPQQSQESKENLKEAFLKLKFDDLGGCVGPRLPKPNQDREDFTNVFLSHACVYSFAEKYDIQALKCFALGRLHETLCKFTLWPECVPSVTALVTYVYSNTPATQKEPMRELLKKYVATELENLVSDPSFHELVAGNDDISRDFWLLVGKRLRGCT